MSTPEEEPGEDIKHNIQQGLSRFLTMKAHRHSGLVRLRVAHTDNSLPKSELLHGARYKLFLSLAQRIPRFPGDLSTF